MPPFIIIIIEFDLAISCCLSNLLAWPVSDLHFQGLAGTLSLVYVRHLEGERLHGFGEVVVGVIRIRVKKRKT